METTSLEGPPAGPPTNLPYMPTAQEQKLLQWTYGRKAFGSAVKKTIENFMYRKDGATLNLLTANQRNELQTQANSLGISLQH